MRPPPSSIKQRPWFIGILSNLIVDNRLRSVSLAPPAAEAFDRQAFEELSPFVPPVSGVSVTRSDLEIPQACDEQSALQSAAATTNGARLYSPKGEVAEPRPLIVYIHGGGWCLNSCFTQPYDSLCADLCRRMGWPVYQSCGQPQCARQRRNVGRNLRLRDWRSVRGTAL